MAESLSAIVFSPPKVGKSWLGQTTPAPRLILDAEGGTKFARRHGEKTKKILWNPETEEVPEYDGTWETCVVLCTKFSMVEAVFKVLNEEDHPFVSLVFDSITEVQKRAKDNIMASGNTSEMTERKWGQLLEAMEKTVRNLRDLTMHPRHPLSVVLILALMQSKEHEPHRADVQGSLSRSLPGFVDLIGYLGVTEDEDGEQVRVLLITPHEEYECGDRTHTLTEHYGRTIADPDFTQMLAVLQEEI